MKRLSLVDTWNLSCRIASDWKLGLISNVVIVDLLGDLGFTAITVEPQVEIVAFYHGVRFQFDGAFIPPMMEAA